MPGDVAPVTGIGLGVLDRTGREQPARDAVHDDAQHAAGLVQDVVGDLVADVFVVAPAVREPVLRAHRSRVVTHRRPGRERVDRKLQPASALRRVGRIEVAVRPNAAGLVVDDDDPAARRRPVDTVGHPAQQQHPAVAETEPDRFGPAGAERQLGAPRHHAMPGSAPVVGGQDAGEFGEDRRLVPFPQQREAGDAVGLGARAFLLGDLQEPCLRVGRPRLSRREGPAFEGFVDEAFQHAVDADADVQRGDGDQLLGGLHRIDAQEMAQEVPVRTFDVGLQGCGADRASGRGIRQGVDVGQVAVEAGELRRRPGTSRFPGPGEHEVAGVDPGRGRAQPPFLRGREHVAALQRRGVGRQFDDVRAGCARPRRCLQAGVAGQGPQRREEPARRHPLPPAPQVTARERQHAAAFGCAGQRCQHVSVLTGEPFAGRGQRTVGQSPGLIGQQRIVATAGGQQPLGHPHDEDQVDVGADRVRQRSDVDAGPGASDPVE